MTEAQQTLLLIKGTMTELPAEEQAAIASCAGSIRELIKAAGDGIGPLALALVGAEMQVQR